MGSLNGPPIGIKLRVARAGRRVEGRAMARGFQGDGKGVPGRWQASPLPSCLSGSRVGAMLAIALPSFRIAQKHCQHGRIVEEQKCHIRISESPKMGLQTSLVIDYNTLKYPVVRNYHFYSPRHAKGGIQPHYRTEPGLRSAHFHRFKPIILAGQSDKHPQWFVDEISYQPGR